MWKEKKALIDAITKYSWLALHPDKDEYPDAELQACSCCKLAEWCNKCLMYNKWPTLTEGVQVDVCTYCDADDYELASLWDIFDDNWYLNEIGEVIELTMEERSQYAWMLVDAFHERLRELYS